MRGSQPAKWWRTRTGGGRNTFAKKGDESWRLRAQNLKNRGETNERGPSTKKGKAMGNSNMGLSEKKKVAPKEGVMQGETLGALEKKKKRTMGLGRQKTLLAQKASNSKMQKEGGKRPKGSKW